MARARARASARGRGLPPPTHHACCLSAVRAAWQADHVPHRSIASALALATIAAVHLSLPSTAAAGAAAIGITPRGRGGHSQAVGRAMRPAAAGPWGRLQRRGQDGGVGGEGGPAGGTLPPFPRAGRAWGAPNDVGGAHGREAGGEGSCWRRALHGHNRRGVGPAYMRGKSSGGGGGGGGICRGGQRARGERGPGERGMVYSPVPYPHRHNKHDSFPQHP